MSDADKVAYGHPDYRKGKDGKLRVRNEWGDWVTNDTLALVATYIGAIGHHNAADCLENRKGYFCICVPLDGYRLANFDDYIRHLDAIVPALADA